MKLLDYALCDEPTMSLKTINADTVEMQAVTPTTQHEADDLVKRFLHELDACHTEQERIAKVWELVHGVARGARKA